MPILEMIFSSDLLIEAMTFWPAPSALSSIRYGFTAAAP